MQTIKEIEYLDPYEALALPLLRILYPKMIAKRILSVTSIANPGELVYHDDYEFNKIDNHFNGITFTSSTGPHSRLGTLKQLGNL